MITFHLWYPQVFQLSSLQLGALKIRLRVHIEHWNNYSRGEYYDNFDFCNGDNIKCIFLTQIYFCIPEIFKTNVSNRFWVQNHLLNLFSRALNSRRLFVLWIHKGYFVILVKKLMWNVRIRTFWLLSGKKKYFYLKIYISKIISTYKSWIWAIKLIKKLNIQNGRYTNSKLG